MSTCKVEQRFGSANAAARGFEPGGAQQERRDVRWGVNGVAVGQAPGADLESYVAVHQGVIFGALTLITGSIWAKTSWGHWWSWDSDQLVLFLVLFLFYCAYFMLRFSLEEGPRRARSSAVYALFGVVLIPVSFLAIRLAEDLVHPTVFTREGPQMTATMFTAFCVMWAAVTLLAYVLYRVELAGKRLDANLRELREALQ